MTDFKVFYTFILGAFGAATGWFIWVQVLSFDAVAPSSAALAVRGAVLGACIGACVSAFEALLAGSAQRTLKISLVGALLGMIAGAVAMPVSQKVFEALGGGTGTFGAVLGGVFAWALFGGVIGLGEGLTKGTQIWKAVLGGVVGGLVGGTIFEIFGRASSAERAAAEQTYVAATLGLLGGFIGASVTYITTALQDAWFHVQTGKLSGSDINISKFVASGNTKAQIGTIGSSPWDAAIYLPGDVDVRARHAQITLENGVPTLQLLPEAAKTGATLLANGQSVTRWQLSAGDRIRIGATDMTYNQRRR